MFSVNTSQVDSNTIKVSNLYKKLGISNNIALMPPQTKEQPQTYRKPPRRQTVFAPQIQEKIKNLQRFNTFRTEIHRSNSDLYRQTPIETPPIVTKRDLTPRSRFISNWIIQKAKEKQNEKENQNAC